MGLHVVALVAKFKIATHGGLSPAVAAIACPLVLKFVMGLRLFRDEAVCATRLFFFRLGQIAFNTELSSAQDTRMERAFRLLCQLVTTTHHDHFGEDSSQIGEDTIRTLSMLTL